MAKKYAYCSKCKSNQEIKYTYKVEGSRQEVQCKSCGSLFWIGGGYGF
jgi:transcription elongation factor Elf1